MPTVTPRKKLTTATKTLSPVEALATIVHSRLDQIGIGGPSRSTISAVLNTLYLASMRTEEGRFIKCCLTFAHPDDPDPESPRRIRAQYPRFTRFGDVSECTPERVVKLSRAIDSWAASLAVYGTARTGIQIWGFADERVHFNLSLHAEGSGFEQPGIFTAVVDGIGQLSVYHRNFYLGSLRYDEVITKQSNGLSSLEVLRKISPHAAAIIDMIHKNLPSSVPAKDVRDVYIGKWDETLRRICIGVQRAGTGGMLILTPSPKETSISSGTECDYIRLRDAVACCSLQSLYADEVGDEVSKAESITHARFFEYIYAKTDEEDREEEITGAVRLISSMATLDGATILDPGLAMRRFGAKINSVVKPGTVYRMAPSHEKNVKRRTIFDYTKYGMRHLSALRYCKEDSDAVVIVISQDGAVRVITSSASSLVVFENVELRDYSTNVADEKRARAAILDRKRRFGECAGYTALPKSLAELQVKQHASRQTTPESVPADSGE